MNPHDLRIDFNALEWLEWVEIGKARSKTAVLPGSRVRLIEFFPGFEQTSWCERGHIGYLIEGEIETELNGGMKVTFRAGDGIVFPRGLRHRSKNIGSGRVLMFLIDDLERPHARLQRQTAEADAPGGGEESTGRLGDN